ncbi:hypothetical protein ACFRCG_03615 [Embleya sp. NPDC056575]
MRTELDSVLAIAETVIANTPTGGNTRPPLSKPDAETMPNAALP